MCRVTFSRTVFSLVVAWKCVACCVYAKGKCRIMQYALQNCAKVVIKSPNVLMLQSSAFNMQRLKLIVMGCASGIGSMNAKIHSNQENPCKATDICSKPFLLRMRLLDATPRALRLEPKSNAKA